MTATPPQHTPLVVATRGDAVENIHFGSVAVVDVAGAIRFHAGDPGFVTFTRSALKAFQALPFLRDDGPKVFGLTDPEIAMLTASHSGEEFHVLAVESILSKSKNHWRRLRCGCHVPYVFETLNRTPPPRMNFDARYHNCSGKHAGFLAYCQLHNLPTETYVEPEHPLQLRIRQVLAEISGLAEASIPAGIDGCSAPNFALPLAVLARLWALLASGADPQLRKLWEVMSAHPEYVSGTERSDLHFARAGRGDWVAKAGADGVQVFGIRSKGLGVAIKISDGNANARYVAAVETLRQLGLVPEGEANVARYRSIPTINLSGLTTGTMRPVFELQGGVLPPELPRGDLPRGEPKQGGDRWNDSGTGRQS